MSICLVDTTIFCNVLDIPQHNQQRSAVVQQLKLFIREGVSLLLPVTTIIETGNHIAQLADGSNRRNVAMRFVEQVAQAIDGTAPWAPTPSFDLPVVATYLAEFPAYAICGIGMGDLSIIKEFDRQCSLHQHRRVFIWSYDADLSGYDRRV